MSAAFGFVGPTYTAISPIIDDELAMNCFVEISESEGAATRKALLRTPGRKIFATLPESSVPGSFTVNGRTFFAASSLYEVNASGLVTNWGSLGAAPTRPTMLTANETQLVVLNNGNLFVFTFLGAITGLVIHSGAAGSGYAPGDTGTIDNTGSTYEVLTIGGGGSVATFLYTPGSGNSVQSNVGTSVLTGTGDGTLAFDITSVANNNLYAVVMSQFNGPINQIGFVDGYIVATLQNSHTWQQSNLEDATVWNGLNIATLSYFPDNIVSMICDHREIWFWGAKKALGYYNAGAGFPVFIPIQGAFMENGSGATFATVQADNSVFWLDQDERGFMVARRLNGYAGDRVSTHAVELTWQQYTTTSDAVAYTYQANGHTFWVIYFPSAKSGNGATWVYDISQGLWHQRGFWIAASGTYIADRGMSHTFNFGKHLVGDWASGNIYDVSENYWDDFGNIIRGNRRSPTISKENEWLYFEQIEFVTQTGLAPSAVLTTNGLPLAVDGSNARPPQLLLRWSNDGGKTWSNWYYLSMGSLGQYNKRVIKRMLGRARKRLWDVAWTDPYPYIFNDAYLKASPATQ
jgi:hypothetical protein